jgi:putative transposase
VEKKLPETLAAVVNQADVAGVNYFERSRQDNCRRPQYLSIRYSERLAEAGAQPSVGSAGDSYDNALAETIIGLYKTEVIRHRGPWRHLEAVEYATLEWVDWFNHRRLLEPIGNVPPAELEASYYHSTGQLPMAA